MDTSLHLSVIREDEVSNLQPLYEALAAHHNKVSTYEHGRYPTVSIEEQLNECRDDLASGKSQVAIVEHADELIAFCKIDIASNRGYIDELCVLSSW